MAKAKRSRSATRRSSDSSSSSSSLSSSKSKGDQGDNGKLGNVQEIASRTAWQVPKRALAIAMGLPIGIMLIKVGSLDQWIGFQLLVCTVISIISYFVTRQMIPLFGNKVIGKLNGVDIGKRGLGGENDGKPIPESLGIVTATVFMICLGTLQFLFGTKNDQLLEYHAALLSVCFATLLGLVDDIIDIKWRHKLPLGAFMSLPLLLSYSGNTIVLVPRMLSSFLASTGAAGEGQTEGGEVPLLAQIVNQIPTVHVDPSGDLINLGALYYVYMLALVVFSTNAINIYAGINGLEVGQSIVVACSIAFMNLMDLDWRGGTANDILSGDGRNHLFSLMMMLPFIATSAALLRFNFYPAQVFVGDVYPYYAGMCLAVAAILGHFSKSFLLLIIPQVLNFVYSLPQLFRIVPIPRHRLPRVDLKTGMMHASKVAPNDDRSNMTLICLALEVFGPMHERTLCVILLIFQALCSVVGIFLRSTGGEQVFSY